MDNKHGEYIINVEGNIISVVKFGTFNKIGIQACLKELQVVVECFGQRKFSLLTNNIKLLGVTPQAYSELDEFYLWLNQKNIVANAIVFISPVLLDISKTRVQSSKRLKIKVFTCEYSAKHWLQVQMLKFRISIPIYLSEILNCLLFIIINFYRLNFKQEFRKIRARYKI